MTDRPPIPPEWHDDINIALRRFPHEPDDIKASEQRLLDAAPPAEEPKPTHDPEVVEAVQDAINSTDFGLSLDDVVICYDVHAVRVLDALADEGYEVVRKGKPDWAIREMTRNRNALRAQLAERDRAIETLMKQLGLRDDEIGRLRKLPTMDEMEYLAPDVPRWAIAKALKALNELRGDKS